MILPPSHVAAGPATATLGNGASATATSSPDSGYDSENWSSLIGIITAIVGNVMISFALNMQRYAHIRLEREWQEKERKRKRTRASYTSNGSSARTKKAEQRERKRRDGKRKYHPPRHSEYTVESERDSVDEGYVATEADPLIPSVLPERRSSSRPSVDSTESVGEASEPAFKQKSYLKSPYWWAGIILMTCGEAGNFLAYGFAPASIVSPLGVVALISNCIIAPFMLHERFRKRDGLGVLIAVAGAVTVVASASDNNPKLGPDEIWSLISTWEFETYFGITLAVIIALMVASNKFGEKNILIDLGLVGLFGGYTALSTKGVASMLSYTLWRAITFPVTYLLVFILVGTAIMQIKYVNRALQRFDATQVIPVQFVLFTLSVILGSAILYRDFERTSGGDAGKFVGGCVMTFLGVWLITSGRPRQSQEEEDRDPEPEDAINLVNGERYHDDIDGASEEAGTSSRRSSTLRETSPPIAINTRITSHGPSPPATPDITFTPHEPTPQSQSPSSTHAIPSVPSPLARNPWEEEGTSPSPSARPPPATLSCHTTFSTPVLPSEVAGTPPAASTSSPELSTSIAPPPPHTPTRGTSDHIIPPVTPGTAGSTLPPRLRRMGTAERTGVRNSIPGPLLASPLSTSLSAMVADLKRGGSLRSQRGDDGSVRRRESVLGIGTGELDANDEDIGEPLDRRRTATEDVSGRQREGQDQSGRSRSLSGTLNELWRGLRGVSVEDVSCEEGRQQEEQQSEEQQRR